MTVGRPSGSLTVVDVSLRLVQQQINPPLWPVQQFPDERISIDANVIAFRIGFVPNAVTVCPLTATRPEVISSSALRREATPAAAIIF
jgi:hypothetical protein